MPKCVGTVDAFTTAIPPNIKMQVGRLSYGWNARLTIRMKYKSKLEAAEEIANDNGHAN